MTAFQTRATCLIVVPMKDPARSKSRLSTVLSETERRSFARLLFDRTLMFLKAQPGDFDVAVTTSSAEITEIASKSGIEVIEEPRGSGLSRALQSAADWAAQQGYQAICIWPADLAAPKERDFTRLISRVDEREQVVVCPASDQGTNALLVSPPQAIVFQYGPRSAVRHMSAAIEAGLNPVLMPLESLKYDIDTSDGLAQALELAPDLKQRWSRG